MNRSECALAVDQRRTNMESDHHRLSEEEKNPKVISNKRVDK